VNRPTVSQAGQWNPDALRDVAEAWEAAAGHLQAEAHANPVDDGWAGSAATAGNDKMAAITRSTTDAARRLVAAAAAARNGAERIGTARQAVLTAVADASAAAFTIADDGTAAPADGAAADPTLRLMCGGERSAIDAMLDTRATELTRRITASLDQLGIADTDTAHEIDEAFGFGAETAAATQPAGATPLARELVSGWPNMSQDRIAGQLAAMTAEQRQHLVTAMPHEVGNTDGVPWDMRVAANRINVADAILDERRTVDRSAQDKVRAVIAERYGARLDPASAERARAIVLSDPAKRADAVAEHDRDANRRIAFYRSLLSEVPDPTRRSDQRVDRQILAFDPARSSLVELTGDLASADNVGVLVPGLNTTVLDSAANTETVRRFVAAGRGSVAMITYLGGPFPTGQLASGILNAGDPRFALDMAPRLVAFSEDVNRTVDATGRPVAVTYLGHSYGGSILGTAERFGLTADRTVYVEAAGAGVGVHDPADWHNRNPDVERFSMTAPGDPIELVQGFPLDGHGADPDTMPGVVRLDTGRRLDGSLMSGPSAHSAVVNEPSDAWRRLLGVITGSAVR
jgi:hypothetical protein